MRLLLRHIVFCILLLAGFFVARGQGMSTMGSDFWLGFMDNNDNRLGDGMLKVLVSGPRDCMATLSNPTGWEVTVAVHPNVVSQINVPQYVGYMSNSCQVNNGGFHLTSTDSVSVYVSVEGLSSYDVSNVYPTRVLRDEYMIQTYESDRIGSEFNIIAAEDNTWVDIYLTCATDSGHPAGSTLSVFLPYAGKSYQVKSPAVGDFTGTVVKSRNCKRIAVFQGDVCVYIPEWTSGQSCDHVEEQCVPVAYWGREFMIMGSGSQYDDKVRVTSLRDSCEVWRNGYHLITMNAGQTVEFAMNSQSGANYLQTSKPVCVNVFFGSTSCGTGDPSMVTICPLEQNLKEVTFASFNSPYTSTHYVNIVAKTDDVGELRMDGNAIPSHLFTTSYFNSEYSYARMQVGAGSHTLRSLGSEGFTAYAYGMGIHESYGYSVGANMIDLKQRMMIDDLSMATINDTVDVCEGDSVFFRMYAEYDYDSVAWDLGDGVRVTGDSAVYMYLEPGLYQITLLFYSGDTSCFAIFDTLRSNVRVNMRDTVIFDTSVCGELFVWFGDEYDSSGSYSQMYVNVAGCNSVRYLNLSMLPNVESVRTVSGCDSVMYEGNCYHYGDIISAGVYTATNGCDSVDKIRFITFPSYDITINAHLDVGDSLMWIDGETYSEPTDSAYVVLHTVNGCDSIVRLRLAVDVEPSNIDSAVIWVPNAFTPDNETNSAFWVYSNNVIMMRVYIYRRNGLYVADFDGLTDGWDGTCKGVACPEEAYVYLIEYTTQGRPQYVQKKIGTVLLIR